MTTTSTDPIRLVRSLLEFETSRLEDTTGDRITHDTSPMLSNYLGGIRAALAELERHQLEADVDQLADADQPLTADQYLDLDRRIRQLELIVQPPEIDSFVKLCTDHPGSPLTVAGKCSSCGADCRIR